MTVEVATKKAPRKRFYRKRAGLFNLLNQIKLWPSRNGILHGVKTIQISGNQARLTTHCHKEFQISNSRGSRAARWLRNKWFVSACRDCRVPDWKLEKYSSTIFQRHQGSLLTTRRND